MEKSATSCGDLRSTERIANVFRGNSAADREWKLCSNVVKIFISSSGKEFYHERQKLFTVVLPELQNQFRPLGVDVQFADSHESHGQAEVTQSQHAILQAQLLTDQLNEISECHRLSPSCFLLCLVGNKYGVRVLPSVLSKPVYVRFEETAQSQNLPMTFLHQLYEEDRNSIPTIYRLRPTPPASTATTPATDSAENSDKQDQSGDQEADQLQQGIQQFYALYEAAFENAESATDIPNHHLKSVIEKHLMFALRLSENDTERIMCRIRTIEGINLDHPMSDTYLDISPNPGTGPKSLDKKLANFGQTFRDSIRSTFKDSNNLRQYSINWTDKGVNPEDGDCNKYLQEFCEDVLKCLKEKINRSLECRASMSSLTKPLQDLFVECIDHIAANSMSRDEPFKGNDNLLGHDFLSDPLQRIETLMTSHSRLGPEEVHGPIVVRGGDGCGKSSLLVSAYSQCPSWLSGDDNKENDQFDGQQHQLVRVVRHLGRTPASLYTPVLVQSLFCQLTLACNLSTSQINPNMTFGELLAHLRLALEAVAAEQRNFRVVIVLDDLQELRQPDLREMVASGLLTWRLPPNVHLLCSIHSDYLVVAGGDLYAQHRLLATVLDNHPLLRQQIIDVQQPPPDVPPDLLENAVDAFLANHSKTLQSHQRQWLLNNLKQSDRMTPLFLRLLAEEILLWPSFLVLPDAGDTADSATTVTDGDPRPVTSSTTTATSLNSLPVVTRHIFCKLENRFGKHAVSRVAQHMTCALYGLAETEIFQLLSFADDVFPSVTSSSAPVAVESGSRTGQLATLAWSNIKNAMRSLLRESRVGNRVLLSWRHHCIGAVAKQLYLSDKVATATHSDIANLFLVGFLADKEDCKTQSNMTIPNDCKWLYSFRQIDQLWYHLLQAGDISRIKKMTACNFEFLYASLCTVSVRYVVGILEFVRAKILDFEIELIYHVIKLSLDILCKNPLEFAPVVISWLRPYAEAPLDTIDTLVTQAMEWCDAYEDPLLVPLNTWVWNPVPETASTLTCTMGITCFVLSHDNQNIICSDREKAIHMYCLPSRRLLKTFTGHYGKVVCLHVSCSGKYLISGSEDTTTIVWDIQTCGIRHRISEHIATVTCVSTTLNDTFIISGSEDSRVLIADMETGKVVYKLEHHRGMISCLAVANDADILITGAADSAVCVWSLENFALLNTLFLPSPVINMDVSNDRTFLLIACEDNKLYLRSLTTGSEIHTIEGHNNSAVVSMCIASDNSSALIGCEDHQIYMYDLHSTNLLRVFGGHEGPITGIKVTMDGGFMFTAGGDTLKIWYFTPNKSASAKKHQDCHSDKVLCLEISKDGTMGMSGSADGTCKIWQLGTSDLHTTLKGHNGAITCIACAPSCLFCVTGSEDKQIRAWGVSLGNIISTFKGHDAAIVAVKIGSDSRKVLSADSSGFLKLWHADNGEVCLSCRGPTAFLDITTNLKFAICGSTETYAHIWTLSHDDRKNTVNHKDKILCHALTFDSRHLITGSKDKSLKVWEVIGGRLTQVLVGHTAAVTCVALAPLNRNFVISGSEDYNLIVWDMQTGNTIHTLSCHTDAVTCVQLSVDGHTAVSGSKDSTICVWDTQGGQLVTLFNLHRPIINMVMSFDAGHVLVHLRDCNKTPILCFHNCPPIDMQAYHRLEMAIEKESSLQAALPRKLHRRILQKEMSLDSYTWAKKYGNFPGKRSFSASLEDFTLAAISPISSSTQNLHNLAAQSKTNLHLTEQPDELQGVWDGTQSGTHTPTRAKAPSTLLGGGGCLDPNSSAVSAILAAELASLANGGAPKSCREVNGSDGSNVDSDLLLETIGTDTGLCTVS